MGRLKLCLIVTIFLFMSSMYNVYAVEYEETFDYTGGYQEFVAPYTGEYLLEVWGAGGGGQHQAGSAGVGGLGGYSKGIVTLKKGDTLYVYVGGEGKTCITAGCTAPAGYNGGGTGYKKYGDAKDPVGSGGGATDIRFVSGEWNNSTSLLSRLIVAGGGGGGGMETNEHGGDGGGLSATRYNSGYGAPGTQTTGWAFGYGYSCSPSTINYVNTTWGGSGGGGGWYGGSNSLGSGWHSAGGGSGFIWNESSKNNVPKNYSVESRYYIKDSVTLAGNQVVPKHDGTGTMTGTRGNGFAKITLSKLSSPLDVTFPITSNNLDFAPFFKEGKVDIEVEIPNTPFETIINYDTDIYIWGNNVGNVTLEDGKTIEVVLMNRDGEISIYNITSTLGTAKLNNVIFDKGTYEFERDVYEYKFAVDYDVKEFNPVIEVPNGVSYTQSKTSLFVGENIITIDVTGNNLKPSTYKFVITRNSKENISPIVNNYTFNTSTNNGYYEFVVPYTTDYILEVWGASGNGNHIYSDSGNVGAAGRGGYSKGIVRLTAGETIYIYVGSSGGYRSSAGTVAGGYNGGGAAWKTTNDHWTVFSGGGATDIRLVGGNWNSSASLLSRIIVAGGGGGASMSAGAGGYGGGTTGGAGAYGGGGSGRNGVGGTQTSASTGASFGVGASSTRSNGADPNWGSSGGGGGWYGGGVGGWGSGAGGSGFVWTDATKGSVPSGYLPTSKYYLRDATIIAGNATMPNYANTSNMTGNLGNGYARITYYNPEELDEVSSIDVDKGEMTPEFDKDVYEYDLILNKEDVEITIDAETLKGEGLIIGTGKFNVPAGENKFLVTFTNTNGVITNYNINVSRPAVEDATIKGFRVNGILYEVTDPEKLSYEIELPTEIEKINLEIIKKYPDQIVTGDTIFDFTETEVSKTIVVESEKSLSNKIYTFKFVRKKSSELKRLNLSTGKLNKVFSPKITEYDLEIFDFVREVPIEAIPYFEDAKVSIVENRYVGVNDKQIIITVDLEGVPSTTYTLNIVRVEPILEPIDEGYNYTGDYQEFIAPASSYYTLEVWGASGGGNYQYSDGSNAGAAGAGGYSKGTVYLSAGEKLYIYVGGKGTYKTSTTGTILGGYNGGGSAWKNTNDHWTVYSGGGATDIRFISGLWNDNSSLLSRLIVAGGGGGASMSAGYGGAGGGTTGGVSNQFSAVAGTQTSAAKGGTFGKGADSNGTNGADTYWGSSGAGGGWYGGGVSSWGAGAGGSGFIWTKESAKNVPTGYSVSADYYLKDAETISGNTKIPNHTGTNLMNGNIGDGYARITANPGIVGDTFLDSILVDNNPSLVEFYPWELTYEINLSKEYGEVLVEATPKDSNAKVFGTGNIKLKPGLNEHKITVTTDDGASKTYTLKINREASDDSTPTNILLKNPQVYLCGISENYCKYTFIAETETYDILLPFETEQITLEAILRSEYQSVKYYTNDEDDNGVQNRVEVTDGIYNLHTGLNIIEVDIISEDGNHTSTYVYRIMKDDAGNNNLLKLNVIDPLIDINFNPYVYEYYFNIDASYEKIDLEVETQNPQATKTITGNENLKSGMNDIRIVVKAPNGNEKTYLLHVFKEKSTNTFLSSLNIVDNENNNVEFTPVFQKVLTEYTAEVDEDTKSITINAIAEDGVVTGDGVKTLVSGKNVFPITVTSESGDITIYNVIIMKAKNSNSNLLNIEVEGYTLTPTFSNDNKIYSLIIPKSVTSLNVIVTPEEETTTYTIKGNNNLNNMSNTIVITSVAEDKSYQTYEIKVSKEEDTNNYLSSINLNTGSLNEIFNKENLNYTMNVSGDVTSLTINGVPEVSTSTVNGNGTYALVGGANTITLTVTSEDRKERVYTIVVNRELDNDVTLKEVTNSLDSVVVKNTDTSKPYDYLINVQYEVSKININGIANSKTSVVSGGGNINLIPGDNSITLRVTAEDNSYKDYIVMIVRDKSNNDDLDFLFVEEGGVDPHFNETIIFYDVKVPNDTNLLHIEAIPEDKNATFEVVGGIKVDSNNYTFDISAFEVDVPQFIEVVVTAENGTSKKTYTLGVTKQQEKTENENISLSDLTTNRGDLTPTFNPDILYYELTVENDVTDIDISAVAFDNTVRVVGTGTYNLNVGKNGIAVFVIGESGVQKDYQIVVTRKTSNDARLSSLVVKGHTLSPSFNKDTYNYTLSTSLSTLEFTTIKPLEDDATYEIIGNENLVSGTNTITIRVTAPDGETTKDYVLTVDKARSKNNNLASLLVDGFNLSPAFHKGVTFYTIEVPKDLNSVIINAIPEDPISTVSGIGLKTLDSRENYFNIEVTAENGITKVYTILITKEASDNNYLASLNVSEGHLDPVFNKETLNYEVIVPYTVSSININGTLEDAKASVVGFDNYNLVTGDNIVNIVVISESGSIKTYTIKVIKEAIVSSYLSDLSIPNMELDATFNKELLEYFITVDYEVNDINLNYLTEDPNATVVVTGDKNLSVGMNEIHVTVTASDNSSTTDYIIYVNRQMSTNNYLKVLSVDNYTINPVFDSEGLIYNLIVPRDVDSINITAITEDASATITSGIGTHNLELGLNTILVKVKSMIGITRTYKINITRKQSDNNYLQSLVISNMNNNLTLNPTFDKDTNTYSVSASSDMNFVSIKASAMDENATISGTGTKELVSGINHFEIVVTAEDGSINTYNIDITKDVSSNNYLANLVPSQGSLTPIFDKDVLEYTLELSYEADMLSFTATPESNLSKINGIEASIVPEGKSTRLIIVTAEDGSVKTYKVNVMRETAAEARLENLEIAGYPFEFDPDTFTYNIQVSNSKKVLLESEITAIPKDENATVNMMGDLNLVDGIINIYVIEVIAKDGYTTQTYTLNITRDSAEYTLRSDKYEIVRFEDNTNEDYVIGIQPSTIISDFKNNFENNPEDLKVYLETSEVDESELTATALVLKLEKNGRVYDTLRVIVRGDLTKDGKVNITDQVKMINYVGRTTTFDKYQMLAGDLTFDGKVNITDQVKIINYVGRTISDLNNKPTS